MTELSKKIFLEWELSPSSIIPPAEAPVNFDTSLWLDGLEMDTLISVLSAARTTIVSKAQYASQKLCDLDILVPNNVIVSQKQYLNSLDDSAMLTVLIPEYTHGNAGDNARTSSISPPPPP